MLGRVARGVLEVGRVRVRCPSELGGSRRASDHTPRPQRSLVGGSAMRLPLPSTTFGRRKCVPSHVLLEGRIGSMCQFGALLLTHIDRFCSFTALLPHHCFGTVAPPIDDHGGQMRMQRGSRRQRSAPARSGRLRSRAVPTELTPARGRCNAKLRDTSPPPTNGLLGFWRHGCGWTTEHNLQWT